MVHAFVGLLKELLSAFGSICTTFCQTNAGCKRQTIRAQSEAFLNHPTKRQARLLNIGVRHDHHELFAAPAHQTVSTAQVGQKMSGAITQHLITGIVTEGIVDRLEVIEIDESHSQAAVVTSRGIPLQLHDFLAAATRENPCQRVANGLAHQRNHER